MSVVVFDLYGTLIFKKKYEYDKALHWLADTYFEHRFNELKELSDKFKQEYVKNRALSYKETPFCNQLKFFEDEVKIKIYDKYQFVEWQFMRRFREEEIFPGVVDLLSFLNCHGCKMYLLTNSMFSGYSIREYLKLLEIDQYFNRIYSSSDIGFRKPRKETFDYVLHDLHIENPSEIYYIGDSYEKDYTGALAAGLKPILVMNDIKIDVVRFDNFQSLLEYFRNIYGE